MSPWYKNCRISTALFDVPFCHALDRGDLPKFAEIVGVNQETAHEIRCLVGDCGACRLFSIALATQPENDWTRVAALSPQESEYYAAHVGRLTLGHLKKMFAERSLDHEVLKDL